jgi:hypothetical protein
MKRFFSNKKDVLMALLLSSSFVPVSPIGAGEGYTRQGHDLGEAIINALMEKGYCRKTEKDIDCVHNIPVFVGNGNRIHKSYYEIGEQNREMFLFIVNFVARKGVEITGGVPISIYGYHETHEEYRTSGIFFKDVKPFFYMEINK